MSLKKFEDFGKSVDEKAKASKSSRKPRAKKASNVKLKRDKSKKPNPIDRLLKQFEGYDNSDLDIDPDMGLEEGPTNEREHGFYWVEINGKMTIAEWAYDPDGNDFWIPAGEEFEPSEEPTVIEYIEPPLYNQEEIPMVSDSKNLKSFRNFSITEKKKDKKDYKKDDDSGLTAKQKKLPKPLRDALIRKKGKSPKKDDEDNSKKDDKKDKKEEVKGSKGLTAKQKKLPPGLQKAILAKK